MDEEEELETMQMQRERIAYEAGYRAGARQAIILVVIFFITSFLLITAIHIITT